MGIYKGAWASYVASLSYPGGAKIPTLPAVYQDPAGIPPRGGASSLPERPDRVGSTAKGRLLPVQPSWRLDGGSV